MNEQVLNCANKGTRDKEDIISGGILFDYLNILATVSYEISGREKS